MAKMIDKTNRSVFPDGSSVRNHNGITGIVRVHESVVASIVRKAACSVAGVTRLAGNMLMDNIAEFVGSRKVLDRAISIDMGENEVAVELRIIVAFGSNIPEVARSVQGTVADELTRITGMQVRKVDIIVADVEMEENPEDSEEENPEAPAEDR